MRKRVLDVALTTQSQCPKARFGGPSAHEMMLVEVLQFSRIQYRAPVCEHVQPKLRQTRQADVHCLMIGETNICDDLGKTHDRRTVWRFSRRF